MWYRDGTISVTASSSTVTGAGTSWVQNARVGDALQGPDGRLYEITNIASNTALSITPAYLGSTASGAPHWIIPVQGYVKRSADRLAAITDDIGGMPIRLDGAENRLDGAELRLDGAEGRLDSAETELGDHDDRIDQNATSIANAMQSMLTKSGNLASLENLKQSQLNLGVIETLTGEVLSTDNCEVIANNNGIAYRFPSGLQMVLIPQTPSPATGAIAIGSLFRSNDFNVVTWPAPFVERPAACVGLTYPGGEINYWATLGTITTTRIEVFQVSAVSRGSWSGITVAAVGRYL